MPEYFKPSDIARKVIIEEMGGAGNLTPSQVASQVMNHSQSQNGVSLSAITISELPLEQRLELIDSYCMKYGVSPEICQAAKQYHIDSTDSGYDEH